MKRTLVTALIFLGLMSLTAQETFKVYGTVTDFNNVPIDSVTVKLENEKFQDIYLTLTDKHGNYSLEVPKGIYYCLYAIKLPDYGKTRLEYWTWNVPVFKDLNINPQYHRMEIYGINAFVPQVSPFNTYMIYFRPMSLTKSLRKTDESNKKQFEKNALENHDTIDIAPQNITPEELTIKINNEETKILSIQKITEYARGAYLYGYMVQVTKPEKGDDNGEYDKITITLNSKETNETGKGEAFIRKKVASPIPQ